MLALQLDEDAAASRRRMRDGVHREARGVELAVEHRGVQRVPGDTDDLSVQDGDRPERPGGIAVEPPVELVARHRAIAPRAAQQPQVVLAMLGLVADQPEVAHLLDVPRAALNQRRACVPATVSLTPMRSQAPASTSSNVRAG